MLDFERVLAAMGVQEWVLVVATGEPSAAADFGITRHSVSESESQLHV